MPKCKKNYSTFHKYKSLETAHFRKVYPWDILPCNMRHYWLWGLWARERLVLLNSFINYLLLNFNFLNLFHTIRNFWNEVGISSVIFFLSTWPTNKNECWNFQFLSSYIQEQYSSWWYNPIRYIYISILFFRKFCLSFIIHKIIRHLLTYLLFFTKNRKWKKEKLTYQEPFHHRLPPVEQHLPLLLPSPAHLKSWWFLASSPPCLLHLSAALHFPSLLH